MDQETTQQIQRRVLELLAQIRRRGARNLLHSLQDSDYFTAPASTRFHGNHKHGLMLHSYYVYLLLKEKNEKYGLNLAKESLIIVGLLHDLCKVNQYKENKLRNGERSKAKPYEYEDCMPLGHGVKSMRIIEQFIKLTDEEAMLIRWHMGSFDYDYKYNSAAVRTLAPAIIAVQTSDMEASAYLDKKIENER